MTDDKEQAWDWFCAGFVESAECWNGDQFIREADNMEKLEGMRGILRGAFNRIWDGRKEQR